jgi:hypothetical protein
MEEKIAKQSLRPTLLGFAASVSSAPSEAPLRAPRLNKRSLLNGRTQWALKLQSNPFM